MCPGKARFKPMDVYSRDYQDKENAVFLNAITLIHTTPCLAEPSKIIVTGKPSRRLDEVLPYLATLPNVIGYNPGANSLSLRRKPGFITLFSQRVSITQVKDVQEGLDLLDALKDAINAVWENRGEVLPIKEARRAPQHLDIYALLPKTNCKKCGEVTCLAFAVSLVQQKHELNDCIPIQEEANFAEQRVTLEAML